MADLFRRTKGGVGYDAAQVDDFMARAQAAYEGRSDEVMTPLDVRNVAFEYQRGGYDQAQVDGALDRLDAAFSRKVRSDFITQRGQGAWLDQVVDRATTLYDRLGRPRGQRFRSPEGFKRGYDKAQVDRLLDRLSAYFNEGTPLKSNEVRYAVFTPVRGGRSYDQAPVDAFLDRALEVLLAAE